MLQPNKIEDELIGNPTTSNARAVIKGEYEKEKLAEFDYDEINHPSHYTSHPSGIECITITEHMSFCPGNAVKYIWRASLKSPSYADEIKDLKKARWYIDREIERLGKLYGIQT